MMQRNLVVTEDEAGLRLDRFIADRKEELSRSFAQKLISKGYITIDGLQVKSSYNVCAGDIVKIELPIQRPRIRARAEDIPLDIVFEDAHLIVVNKPAGMAVHPAAGLNSGTLVNAILAHISFASSRRADGLSLSSITPERPGIVHRIDKGTSGLLVVAKTIRAYYSLIDQFKERSVKRKYVAVICGNPKHNRGIITAPIGRSRRDRRKMTVTPVHSREAVTHFSVIERYDGFSLIELTLGTGRTHQIRVHLSHIGHPVAGDPVYGGLNRASEPDVSQKVRVVLQKLSRQALHAQTLGFIHPSNHEYMDFSSPIPEDIQNVIDVLRTAK